MNWSAYILVKALHLVTLQCHLLLGVDDNLGVSEDNFLQI